MENTFTDWNYRISSSVVLSGRRGYLTKRKSVATAGIFFRGIDLYKGKAYKGVAAWGVRRRRPRMPERTWKIFKENQRNYKFDNFLWKFCDFQKLWKFILIYSKNLATNLEKVSRGHLLGVRCASHPNFRIDHEPLRKINWNLYFLNFHNYERTFFRRSQF